MILGFIIGVSLTVAVLATVALMRYANRADRVIAAAKAPEDSAEHEVLTASNVSIPDRHALLETLAAIRAMPEAIGRDEHTNGRYL